MARTERSLDSDDGLLRWLRERDSSRAYIPRSLARESSDAIRKMIFAREKTSTDKPSPKKTPDGSSGGKQFAIWASIIIVAILTVIVACVFSARHLRSRRAKPTLLPGQKLKTWWNNWVDHRAYSTDLSDTARLNADEFDAERASTDNGTQRRGTATDTEMSAVTQTREETAGVDRNTSIRSVMTLPAYSAAARESETTLGREGERGGVDVVVEFPETAEEEEARREEEMSSLHAIRVARRTEREEREQRRRAREQARNNPGTRTSRQQRSGTATTESNSNPTAQELIDVHQSQDRSRRVSSVSYADLGVARHDGSRLRANSSESDRPLLDSAASLGTGRVHSNSTTTLDTTASRHHGRGRSGSSVLSIETTASEDVPPVPTPYSNPSGGHERQGSGATDFELVSLSQAQSLSRSRSASHGRSSLSSPGNVDSGAQASFQEIPLEHPPQYNQIDLGSEEAPPYESPVRSGAPRLPTLNFDDSGASVPSITVTSSPSMRRQMNEDMAAETQ